VSSLTHTFAGTVAILSALVLRAGAQPIPPVPTPRVDGFDPEVRDAILTAYRQAESQPSNGQASGRLGMVLHAHAVYDQATAAYQRAIRLEPKEFAWRYYLALTDGQAYGPEQGLARLSEALRLQPNYRPALLRGWTRLNG
jgi:cytochrome c-type biogenesis protein CcmH/NrfG